jgi:type I restriction enzyme S subunit
MSSEWPVLPLEECLDALIDYRGKTPDKTDSGIPLITAKIIKAGRIETPTEFIAVDNYDAWMRRGIPRAGDVVLTVEAPLGEVAQLGKEKVALAQRVVTLRGKKGLLDSTYLLYLLQSEELQDQLRSRATGTTVLGIKQSELRKVPIKLPPVDVQQEAAGALKALDDRITLLRETNATLEAIAQALFKSWFVDFDPVRAKQAGLAPEGMDEATAALFPDAFAESALGLVPKGWQMRPISEVVEGVYDGPHATPPEADAGPVFLGIKNLTGTALDFSDIRHINETDWAKWTKRVTPQAGDIVFSYEATLGFFALIPPDLHCCLGRRLALIRPKSEQGAGHFWFHQFVAPPFQRLLAKHTIQGATVNRIALKEFPSYPVLVPPLPLQMAFHEVASSVWAKIQRNQAQAQTLAALRDALLPRLISGQLHLPEVSASFEESVA